MKRRIAYAAWLVLALCLYFFENNKTLKEILLDSVISIGDGFMKRNRDLHTFYAPNAVFIGSRCLECNEALRIVDLPDPGGPANTIPLEAFALSIK